MSAETLARTFPDLTGTDVALLLERAASRTFAPGETIVAKGSGAGEIIVIRDGNVRVQQDDGDTGIVLARLGPGEVLGEMSFIGGGGATACVRAEQAVEIAVIGRAELEALLTADAAFAARFYLSLARVLAARLEDRSERLARLETFQIVEAGRFHTPHTGQVTARQLPAELLWQVRAFCETLRRLEKELLENLLARGQAKPQVASACETIVALLADYASDEAVLEIAFDDLLSFRDSEDVESGIGGTIFREAYPILMTGAVIARCYLKPRGFPDDFETVDMMYRAEPDGDGALGPLIDDWFLSRPLCRSRRELLGMTVDHLRAASASLSREITGLATGTADEVFGLLSEAAPGPAAVTCIDLDDAALANTLERARGLGSAQRLRLVRADVLLLIEGREALTLPPQGCVYSLGLCDYLDDDDFVRLLDWGHARLAPGGSLAVSNVHASNPDRLFMEHMLEWPLRHRTEDDMRRLFARSAFAAAEVTIRLDETGAGMLASAAKS